MVLNQLSYSWFKKKYSESSVKLFYQTNGYPRKDHPNLKTLIDSIDVHSTIQKEIQNLHLVILRSEIETEMIYFDF